MCSSQNTNADSLIKGAIDFHVHASPDPVRERSLDALELARQSQKAGMRAVVIKSHHYNTAPLADAINQVVPGFSLIGSLVLNSAVGGLNPEAVEVAVLMGAKVIWMPTYSSLIDTQKRKSHLAAMPITHRIMAQDGISLLDNSGKLVPDVTSIMEVVKEANAVISTGHISIPEIYALVEAAHQMDVKITVTHPMNPRYGATLTLSQQLELIEEGAVMEYCFLGCMPPPYGGINITTFAEYIRGVGVENCLLSTDFGQKDNPLPLDGFKMMLSGLLEAGISESDLETMVKTTPARLLNLD